MVPFPKKVISGGQTGADIGGLLGAREAGIETGGVAPRGWLTEDGPQEELLRTFGLIECQDEGLPARTRHNVENSSGTLLVGQYQTGGSRLTYDIARMLNKPLFLIAFPKSSDLEHRVRRFCVWLARHRIEILNVAGNRESQSPGIAEFTRSFLLKALRDS